VIPLKRTPAPTIVPIAQSELTGHGSYDVVLAGSSTSRGRSKIVVSDGRLLVEGEKGRGAGTLLRTPPAISC
jgi:hypothetical protein